MVVDYLGLTQRYVTLFCTEAEPNRYAEPVFETALSQRWHRVAIQQAAGIARAFRTNRENAYQAYLEDLADDAEVKAEAKGTTLDPKRKGPKWREWKIPELHVPCIQANAGAGGGGELRGRDVRLLAQNFHAGQRQASAHPCETLVLPQKSP